MRHEASVLQRMASAAPADCAISTITTYELYTGVEKCLAPAKELAKVNLLLSVVSSFSMKKPQGKQGVSVLFSNRGDA
jgi:predicted nucleic acid-binding protein